MSKQRLIKNSVAGLIQFFLTAVLTLISVPVFIHKLGIELYGIFAVVAVIGNLNFLTNFGLNTSLLVYVAKQGKCRESDHDIAVTLVLILGIVITFITLILIFKEFIVLKIFSIPQQYSEQASLLLLFMVISSSFLLIGQIYSAVLDALQKIYLTNIIQFIYSTIYWGGIITVVYIGGDLSSVGITVMIAAAVWCILVFCVMKYNWGKLDLVNFGAEFKRVASKQIKYGFKIYFAGLTGFMFEPLSKILLSNFIGLNAVAFFEIGIKLKGQISGILFKMIYPLLPFIANSIDNADLKNKVYDLSKKIQLIISPAVILAGFVTPILIKFWIGESNYTVIVVFAITMTITMLLFSVPILPLYQYLAAKNLADRNIVLQLSAVIVNLIVFFISYNFIGVYGILLSNTLAFFTSYVIGYYFQSKYLGVNYKNELIYYLKIVIYTILCSMICIIIKSLTNVTTWDLIIYPGLVLTSFPIYIRLTKLIIKEDIDNYFETVPMIKNKLYRILIT